MSMNQILLLAAALGFAVYVTAQAQDPADQELCQQAVSVAKERGLVEDGSIDPDTYCADDINVGAADWQCVITRIEGQSTWFDQAREEC